MTNVILSIFPKRAKYKNLIHCFCTLRSKHFSMTKIFKEAGEGNYFPTILVHCDSFSTARRLNYKISHWTTIYRTELQDIALKYKISHWTTIYRAELQDIALNYKIPPWTTRYRT